MAIHTIDLDRRPRFTINVSIAMIVLREVAIVALHPFFEMDVRQVDGFAEAVRIFEADLLAVFVEPIPLAVVIEDGAENPAMAMEIGELRGLQLFVEFGAAHVL